MRKAAVLAALLVLGSVGIAQGRATFDIGFRVTADGHTNVVVKYRVTCSNGADTVSVRGRVQAQAPLVRHVEQTMPDATSCRIRAVAWDIKPHVVDPDPPVVRTWVNL